jgi:hypothetical protein
VCGHGHGYGGGGGRPPTCFNCGEIGHVSKYCIEPHMICAYCYSPEHVTEDCLDLLKKWEVLVPKVALDYEREI